MVIFQFSLNSCNFLLKRSFWIILHVLWSSDVLFSIFYNFSTLLTWIFCPPSQSGCQHRIVGRIGWWFQTISEWLVFVVVLLAGLVDESWRHWTGWLLRHMTHCNVIVTEPECFFCEIPTGRSIFWYDLETIQSWCLHIIILITRQWYAS